MFRAIKSGISSYLRVIHFIQQNHLWRFFWYSGIISFGVSLLVFGSATALALNSGSWIENLYPFDWGRNYVSRIGEWVLLIILYGGSLFILKYVIIIALGPLLSVLSEHVEEIECGGDGVPKFTWGLFIRGLIRGLRINIRNAWKELLFSLLLLLLGLFPGFALVTGPLILLVQAYYAGFGNFDLYLERHLTYRTTVAYMRNHKLPAVVNGALFLIILSIPVLGWVLAPFMAVTAASLHLNKAFNQ